MVLQWLNMGTIFDGQGSKHEGLCVHLGSCSKKVAQVLLTFCRKGSSSSPMALTMRANFLQPFYGLDSVCTKDTSAHQLLKEGRLIRSKCQPGI